jgi:hypothetical protein
MNMSKELVTVNEFYAGVLKEDELGGKECTEVFAARHTILTDIVSKALAVKISMAGPDR